MSLWHPDEQVSLFESAAQGSWGAVVTDDEIEQLVGRLEPESFRPSDVL
jgi:hypothetical protein